MSPIFATARLTDGRAQVWFASNGHLFTNWAKGLAPTDDWSGWSRFQQPPGTLLAMESVTIGDGRPQLWAVTDQGLFACWKASSSPKEASAQWTNWDKLPSPPTS